jgi:chromosome segregation ATPase
MHMLTAKTSSSKSQAETLAVAKSKDSPSPPLNHSLAAAEAKLAESRRLRERTKGKVETLTAQVEDARKILADGKRTLGERKGDGEDTTSITRTVKQAHDHLDALEAALVVAIQKDDTAQSELEEADRQVLIAAEAAACEGVLELGERSEEVYALVRQFAVDLARATEALRVAGGNEKYALSVNQILAQFEFFLRLASHPRTTDYPSALKKYESFTACLVAVCGMRAQQ